MTKTFLKWWLALLIQFAFVGITAYYGYFGYVLENDATYLSFIIVFVWLITSVYVGFKTKVKRIENFEVQWFLAEGCMTLGMIGTVIGFLLMLGTSFADINVEDTSQMANAIANMAVGLSTALITTLNGLVASLFLKTQIVIVEQCDETQVHE